MRFIHLPSIAWLACALVVTAAPAAAWNKSKCELKDNAAAFRDSLASYVLGKKPPEWLRTFNGRINTCETALTPDETNSFRKCVARVKTYSNILGSPGLGLVAAPNSPSGQSGLANIDNKTFHDNNSKTNLAVPACLVKGDASSNEKLFTQLQATNLSNATSVEATVNLIESRCPGAVVVPYVTATVNALENPGTGKDNRGRIVVYVNDPTDNISRYVQFSVDANKDTRPNSITRKQASVVNIKRDRSGTYIFDWQRSGNGFVYADQRGKLFGNDTHCYSCHWTGVLAIYPFQPAPGNELTAISWAKGLVTATTTTAHGVQEDQWFQISGAEPTEYNGTFPAATGTTGSKLVYELSDNPGPAKKLGTLVKQVDVNGAALSLGPDYREWLGDLNETYKGEAKALNDQITNDKQYWSKVVGAPVVGQPPLDQFPDVLAQPSNCSAEQQVVINQLKATGCTGCHANRGKGFYEPESYLHMISKYVAGGLMPPKKPQSSDSIVAGSTAASRDDILKYGALARECFTDSARTNVENWLKAADCQ